MSNDIWTLRGSNRNNLLEYVTPHKICVVILIQEFCLIKKMVSQKKQMKLNINRTLFPEAEPESNELNISPIFRRDFCMLVLKLIQSPDKDYEDFIKLLESNKYTLLPELISNFKNLVQKLLESDVGHLMDILIDVFNIPVDSNLNNDRDSMLISKSSKIGIFLRRVRLFFDKLSFSETIGMYKAFRNYILTSKNKVKFDKSKISQDPDDLDAKSHSRLSMDMDLSSINDGGGERFSLSPQVPSKLSFELSDIEKRDIPVGLWSKRQAELFIAQQARLITDNPEQALPPQQLQIKLRDVIATNPEHAEAHFLSYLNCLRVREYGGAVNSLFHFFDRKAPSSYEEDAVRCKGLRYAALNLAILQAQFNRKKDALRALKEAIALAHEANDNVCLQHAQAWMYKLQSEYKDVLIQRSILKSGELNLNYLSSFGLQSYADHAAKHGGLPEHIFEMLSRSDMLNCQHSMADLMATSLCLRSALWALYGRSELACLYSQQLLHLDTSDPSVGTHLYTGGDSIILAISNLANYFTMQGEYMTAWSLVNHGKERVPDSKWWDWSENILYFTESFHKGQWQHAQLAINQLATFDKLESLLRQNELLLVKNDRRGAVECANNVLKNTYDPVLRIRALYLSSKENPRAAILNLCEALHIANFHSIEYWEQLIAIEIANIQLEMGLGYQSTKVIDRSLLSILSHGCCSDMSDSLFLYGKSKIAIASNCSTETKMEIYSEALKILSKAADLARKVENYSKVKTIVYLQAIVCDNIGLIAERNKYAYEFRVLDEEFKTMDSPMNTGQ
ncbi:hypothetical protein O3M35_001692 [Rhynocoris fuscipes]|uniref:Anaphase-promoting complex subunit 5 n=1 Tax=Rhynocoris fuscipes TaxID=488301 RepID=A0AAW1CQ16_9HEMI